jgi:hypothetical protein
MATRSYYVQSSLCSVDNVQCKCDKGTYVVRSKQHEDGSSSTTVIPPPLERLDDDDFLIKRRNQIAGVRFLL